MATEAFVRKLVDPSGNVILPATRSTGVYFNDNSVLQDYVSGNGIVKKATGDKNGKDITTYISGLKVSGRTITYTMGSGSTGTITTQDTTYSAATDSAAGLMSATDKEKLDSIATGANKYTHPTFTSRNAGLYKITVNGEGHVTGATAVAKTDITGLGIPAQDTTYSPATDDTDGLMSSEDKTKLDGIASGANNYTHPSFTAKGSGLYKITVNNQGHVSATANVAKSDIVALGIPGQDTTYSTFKAATSSAAGGTGLVPAPAAGAQSKYLRGDGTWQTPPNTTYNVATDEANGLMSATDKEKLDGIATGANKYTHPTFSSHNAGLYKITVNGEGHVTAATAVTKTDITDLGIPSTNTTYSNATTSADGLMSSEDKTKLNGIATGANNYVHPYFTAKSSGFYKITVNNQGHVSATAAVTASDITALIGEGVTVYTGWGGSVSDLPTTYTA